MNFITVYLLFVLPLPLTLATGAVSFVSQFDVAYYEKHCRDDFSTGCPVHGDVSWVCSKNITNCTSPDYPYHCILNTARKVVHICAAAQICPRGTVPIFDPRTHMVSCQNCQKGYYQPLLLWSNNTPVCKEKYVCDISSHKIECTVEPEKEQTQDTLCRCDARNNYSLSIFRGHICFLGKDGRCIESKCLVGYETLLNYTCAPRCDEGFQRDDSDICVPKSTVITTTEGDKALPTSTASTENVSIGSISGNNITIVIIVISVAVAIYIIITIVLCWKRRDRSRPFNLESCITRLCSWQYRQVQTDDVELRTMSNAQPRNIPNQETPSPVPTDNNDANTVEVVSTNNVPTDNNDANTVEVVSTNNAQSDDPEAGTMRNGTNTPAQPRNIPNQERPSPVPTDNNDANTVEVVSTNNAQTDDVELRTMSDVPTDNNDANTVEVVSTNNAQTDDVELRTMSDDELRGTILNQCLPDLVRYLNFTAVMMYIQQREIFDYVTTRDIMEQATTTKAISMLIEKLKQKPQDKYEMFKDCLVLAHQEDLKKKLEEFEEKITNEIRETH